MIGDTGRRAWPVACGLGAVYVALASLMWEIDPTWGSAFWPAAGVSFAVLVRAPRRRWPLLVAVIALAEATTNLLHGTSVAVAFWGAVANAAEPAIGAGLFRVVGRQRRLANLESLAWLLAGGVIVGPAVGAAFGGVLAVGGPAPAVERWVRWWVGDGVGVLAVAPALLAGRGLWRTRHPVETAALVVTLAAAAATLASSTQVAMAVGPSLVIPVLVWAALRFGVPGAAVSVTGIACAAHWATATGHGVFADHGSTNLVAAQVFIASVGVSCLTVAVLVADIDRRRHAESVLTYHATHDPLTGLGNRTLIDLRATEGAVGAVALIDLDDFKAINDRHGHAAGDAVLVEVAQRLLAAAGPDDLVTRIGGDEFAVLLADPSDDRRAAFEVAVERSLLLPLTATTTSATTTTTTLIPISASVGWAAGPEPLAELFVRADRDMYRRKRAGVHRPPLATHE